MIYLNLSFIEIKTNKKILRVDIMVIGIVLLGWDTKVGATIDIKYPNELELTADLINKIYMTFSYSEEFDKEELIETSYDNMTILSYCDKSRVPIVGYEIISIFLEEKEKINIYQIKKQLLEFGKEIFRLEKSVRNKFFIENIGIFFKKSSSKKILLLGRAGTGKTTIQKIIFEGIDPKYLLLNPLEPTRGISPAVYSWLDLKLGLFDSSGQELNYLLKNENEQDHILAFDNTDYIIYLVDFSSWISKSQEIISEINTILKIIEQKDSKSEMVIFFHKIDLIGKNEYDTTIKDIKHEMKAVLNLPIYFTSIHPELIYNLYNAFYEILSSSSEENFKLKGILESIIKEYSKTMYFITNSNNSIIVQTMSNDFNTSIINHSHKLIAQLNNDFEEMSKDGTINHLILSGSNNINIIMNNLNLSKFGLKNLICLSESQSANKLISLIGEIRLKLKDLYYLNR